MNIRLYGVDLVERRRQRDAMLFPHIISVLVMVAVTFQKATAQLRCQGTQYYNEKKNDCCRRCPQGLVTRSSCVKDINKECASCPESNYFIIWSQNRPKCTACRKCTKESFLVEIQSCSLLSEAICQCKPGYYCHTTLHNSCARCNAHTPCPPGRGVKQKGSPKKDTECEACPSGTFSDVNSATEGCKLHRDCDKLHQVTTRMGSDKADALCTGPIPTVLKSSENTTRGRDETHTTYPTTRDTTTPHRTTSGTFIATTTKAGADDTGKWSGGVYMVAGIICVMSLLIVFLLYWKKKICNLKIWKNFIQPELSRPQKTLMMYKEENSKGNLLRRENSSPFSDLTPETYHRTENTQKDCTMEDKHETQRGRDQLNNRIEKIYIMNADTVLVGSISEVPTRRRSVTMEFDSRESPILVSRYPEQESSKLSANDLMISIEEEERESCTAKAILEV
ncbi:tumor necrosis factor receptor superfamily member 8-like [Rhinoderma darwinii]|uniref:tumor necrosis factor receptor superfamily member 8-like n=1 Tax=Rhinoderma darwinii TaxID=43563 RepID=UPI003F67E7F9